MEVMRLERSKQHLDAVGYCRAAYPDEEQSVALIGTALTLGG